MKRRFAVSCSKSLGRQRSYVLILDFEQHHICLVKSRGGKEIKKVFSFAECTKLEKERKDPRKLSLTFSRSFGNKENTNTPNSPTEKEDYKKTVVFATKDDRELFCNLVHWVIVTGPKAAQLFKKLDKKNCGSIKTSELENGLIDKLAISSTEGQASDEINFYQFLQAMASKRSVVKTRTTNNQTYPGSILSPSLSKLKRGSKLVTSGSEPEEVNSAISEFLDDSTREFDPEEPGGLSEEELAHVLLKGEIPTVQHHAATRLDTSTSSRGALVLTNYRIMYREYNHSKISFEDDSSIDLPLGFILKFIKPPGETTLRFYCKDMRTLVFGFDASEKWIDGLIDQINRFTFPKSQTKLFAFSHTMDMTNVIDGWSIYDIEKEYERLGLLKDTNFRLVTTNKDFKLSPTYPPMFIIPRNINNDELKKIIKHRSKGRIPVVTWMHPHTSATLSRCAQPMSGVTQKSSPMDQKLFTVLREVNPTNSKTLHIVDARPKKAAMGNQMMGRGFEDTSQYTNCSVQFMGIDNIHSIRGSLEKLSELCLTEGKDDERSYLAKLDSTQWLHYIRLILSAAARMARMLDKEGTSVVCHCSDGWDRTAQLVCCTQLMLDPYYRSLEGFVTLIEKDWLSFGHKFAERCGHGDPNSQDTQRAPIFLQWIDAVWQLTRQFPDGFEFNETFLVDLIDHVYSCRFGTFLYNSYQERTEAKISSKTVSIWSHMLAPANRWKYRNPFYHSTRLPLIPNCASVRLLLWEGLHLRWDRDVKTRESVHDLSIRLYLRYQRLRQNIKDSGFNLEELDSERGSSSLSSSGHNRSLSVTPIKKTPSNTQQLRIHSWHNRQYSKTTFLEGKIPSSSSGVGLTGGLSGVGSPPPYLPRGHSSAFLDRDKSGESPRQTSISVPSSGSGRVFTIDQIDDDEDEGPDSDEDPDITGVVPPPPPGGSGDLSTSGSGTLVSPIRVNPSPGTTPRGSLIRPNSNGEITSSPLILHAKSPSPGLLRALEEVATTPIRKIEENSRKADVSPKTPGRFPTPPLSPTPNPLSIGQNGEPFSSPVPPPPPTPTSSLFVLPSPPPPPPPDPDSPLIVHPDPETTPPFFFSSSSGSSSTVSSSPSSSTTSTQPTTTITFF